MNEKNVTGRSEKDPQNISLIAKEFLNICSSSFIWATFVPFFRHVLFSYWSLLFPTRSAASLTSQSGFSLHQLILDKVEANTRYASVTEN